MRQNQERQAVCIPNPTSALSGSHRQFSPTFKSLPLIHTHTRLSKRAGYVADSAPIFRPPRFYGRKTICKMTNVILPQLRFTFIYHHIMSRKRSNISLFFFNLVAGKVTGVFAQVLCLLYIPHIYRLTSALTTTAREICYDQWLLMWHNLSKAPLKVLNLLYSTKCNTCTSNYTLLCDK